MLRRKEKEEDANLEAGSEHMNLRSCHGGGFDLCWCAGHVMVTCIALQATLLC